MNDSGHDPLMERTIAVVYDSHAAVRRLIDAGMPEPQAEAVVREQANLLECNLATRNDIEETKAGIEALRQEIKAQIEALRRETRDWIEAAKNSTLKWVAGMNVAMMMGLVVAIYTLARGAPQ